MRIRYKKNTPDILSDSDYVIEHPEEAQGNWRSVFGEEEELFSKRRLELEIGCGRGRFLCDMAQLHPNTYFVGDERVRTILARASECIRLSLGEYEPLGNVRLIDTDAMKLQEVFAPGEVDRIYLNFSDPWPKKRHIKRRLTSEKFLEVYAGILREGGDLCIKTDNDGLYAYSVETLAARGWQIPEQTDDLHHSAFKGANVMTEYEKNFSSRGKNIHYLRALPPKK
ncbi:MAG: tRNA (guanosine(46)-N7)-methyltransferase TrmB [Lachnospiraceae bacterium]|nr:tRNA (guanosine(46)-N7)-methyltransferase TrmB [Lachnospiraceae bacterium]